MIFAKEVGESLTYKFAQAAADMRAHGREIISLGLGEPDFRTPQYVLDATAEAMNAGFTHYSATQGLPEFRELIAKDMNARFSSEYSGGYRRDPGHQAGGVLCPLRASGAGR